MSEFSKMHLIGSAHLDPVWLWRWQEGCGEVMQTFRSALDRLNEYDDFVFTCSSAAYYSWVKEIDPEMFEEIKQRVQEGRWVPVNGWWVQPDCNIPSAESFARQALYSQLFYYENFGKICRTGYNVDSFGHNANLPQLLMNAGMPAYVMMRPGMHENDEIPESAFIWKHRDGSKVITYRIPNTYAPTGSHALEKERKVYEDAINETGHGVMFFYGVGNHGGGPTKGDINWMLEHMEEDGWHEMEFSSPDDYFRDLLVEMVDLPMWDDELQHHASGCYSATSLVKQLNRNAENELYAAESFSTVAGFIAGMAPSNAEFAQAWKEVCFNQFHDILCGCSIMEAYEDVRHTFGAAINTAMKKYNEATLRIANKIDTWLDGVSDPVDTCVRHHSAPGFARPVAVFNPLSFDVEVPVQTYHPSSRVKDCDGNEVVFSNVRSSRSNDSHLDTVFLAKVPAMGYATYWLDEFDGDEYAPDSDVKASGLCMENQYLKVAFSKETGCITSLVDKASGYDYAAGGELAVPTVIDDHKTDTWAHNVFKFHDIKGVMALESIELIEDEYARAVIRTVHTFGKSVLHQDFILGAKQKTLRVKCRAMWSEQFTMLKTSFKLAGTDGINTAEIPGSFIKRPTNGEEEPHQRWADLTVTVDGTRKGLSIINDSKYSYDCPDNDLRLTLLRNVIFADHYSPRPDADFRFCDEGLQCFEYGIYVHDGEAENSDVTKQAAQFNIRPNCVPMGYHKGTLPQKQGFVRFTADNILMTALKLCEDGSGDVILRCHETKGKETHCAVFCDLVEAGFRTYFEPNEIKTFRINKDGFADELNFLEGIVNNN